MTVTTAHIGRTVTWAEHGRTRTGILHRLPTAGTPDWWRTNGKATVTITKGEEIHHIHIHPADLEPLQEHQP